jgi:hypothetical protein
MTSKGKSTPKGIGYFYTLLLSFASVAQGVTEGE